jgi:predicted site-specific integrase-resolvase
MYLTFNEVAERLGVNSVTLYRWLKNGDIVLNFESVVVERNGVMRKRKVIDETALDNIRRTA